MIEKSLNLLPEERREGTIGVRNCMFRCEGCPETRNPEALDVRAIGFDDSVVELIRSSAPRIRELAGGELPSDRATLMELKEAGLKRIIMPLFGLESSHDARAGIPSAFETTLKIADVARDIKMGVQFTARMELLTQQEIIDLTRLAWSKQSQLILSNPGMPPCFARKIE